MVVLCRQQLLLLFLEPAGLFETLTFWAVAIAAGIVRDLLVCAGIADPDVASEDRGAAVGNGPNCRCLLVVENGDTITLRSEHIGEFQRWTSCAALPG
jgi:hypothetical protein